jgi:hypothetical protein
MVGKVGECFWLLAVGGWRVGNGTRMTRVRRMVTDFWEAKALCGKER